MNTASRSKTSTVGSVLSPCTSSGRPQASMAAIAGQALSTALTPKSELVVAPAG
jgi:hypothetical protein